MVRLLRELRLLKELRILHQSGSIPEWKVGGNQFAVTHIWIFIKTKVVIQRYHKKAPKEVYKTPRNAISSRIHLGPTHLC